MRAFIVMLIVLFPSVLCAQTVTERFEHDFARYHDRGLHVRLAAGLSLGKTTIDTNTSGLYGAQWDLGLGYLLDEGLVVGLESWGRMQSTTGIYSLGPSVTLYPDASKNLFGAIGLGVSTPWDNERTLFARQWGLSAQAMLGTGWWVTDANAAGFCVALSGSHIDLDGDGVLSTAWHVGLMLTVTGD